MNPMMILEMMFGKEKAGAMWQQWQSMSPEQKQAEINKVNSMSPEEKNKYLQEKGTNMSSLMNQFGGAPTPTNNGGNGGSRFNY